MDDLYLAHHGVLGMKWGVRRYQNKDGTLTEAGKRRLNRNIDYRDKLSRRASRDAEYNKEEARKHRKIYNDVKKNKARSRAYEEWLEERDRKNTKRLYDPNDNYGFLDYISSSIISDKERHMKIEELMYDNKKSMNYHQKRAKKFIKSKEALNNMDIDVLMRRRDIRRVGRKAFYDE